MDAQLKAKWVEALRSGEYSQTQNWLRDGEGFCCLGVLCDLSQLGEWSPSNEGSMQRYTVGKDYHRTQFLPFAVKEISGLSGDDCDPIVKMNDDGKSFAEIADYIEAHL
jgi:hypothetical protein